MDVHDLLSRNYRLRRATLEMWMRYFAQGKGVEKHRTAMCNRLPHWAKLMWLVNFSRSALCSRNVNALGHIRAVRNSRFDSQFRRHVCSLASYWFTLPVRSFEPLD